MEVKYVPSLCKGDDRQFEGHVVIDIPQYMDRLDMILSSGLDQSDLSNIEKIDGPKIKLLKSASKHLIGCEIKRIEDGYVYSGIDELLVCSEAAAMVTECLGKVINGVTVGKN